MLEFHTDLVMVEFRSMTPLNSIIQLSSMIEVQLSGLQNSKPSSVLDAENK
jgi:hypothetical protein